MGGLFGIVSKNDCVSGLFYGTDYHSHLGTVRGGLAVLQENVFTRHIHNIENAQFRSKFETDILTMTGNSGIGCISDTEDQPVIIRSHLGMYSIVTVGRINNIDELVKSAFGMSTTHFSELGGGEINPTELVSSMINQGGSFVEGILKAQELIDGSCTMLILTEKGIIAARDKLGRTPLILGEKEGSLCATMETCAFPNLGYRFKYELGPGEVVLLTPEGYQQLSPPGETLRICAFLWVYYGFPTSTYEKMNVETMRYRSGSFLARRDNVEVDMVAGIPDSGTAHAIGYANEAKIPYKRPFIKYTPTWPRSFMPQNQDTRNLVASMKLIPIRDLIEGQRMLFCEDSIVRGTQLRETIKRLYEHGAREVHMRPACPPLIHGCRFLNFSRSRSEMDLAGRWAIKDLVGDKEVDIASYAETDSDKFNAMVDNIREKLDLTTLRYQTVPDMLESIDLQAEKVCTFCWDGRG